MPSSSATVGLVAELLARPRDVARDRVLQLAEHVQRLHVPAASPAATPSSFSATTPATRGTGSGRRRDTREPLGRERVAHRSQHVAQRVRLGVGDPVRVPGRGVGGLGEQHALHEVARVHHRPALRARPDEREPAAPDRGEELRLALGLERTVEPRRPHDHGREVAAVVAALHELLGFELRAPVAPCTGANGESSSKRSSLVAFAPNGEFDETCTNRAAPTRRARSSTSCVPPTFTSKSSRTRLRGVDHRGRVEHRRAADAVEERVDHRRVAHVADDDLDPRVDDLEQRRVGRRRARGTGCGGGPAAPASARTRFWPSQPGGAGDDHGRRRHGRERRTRLAGLVPLRLAVAHGHRGYRARLAAPRRPDIRTRGPVRKIDFGAVRALVVTPTYQESENIVEFLHRARAAAPDADILVVDDNSPDGTADLVDEVGARARPHRGAAPARARSASATPCAPASRSGSTAATTSWCRSTPTSRTIPPRSPTLLAEIEHGADAAIGSRYVPGGSIPHWPWYRRAVSKWGNRYATLVLGIPIRDATSGYRAFRIDMLKAADYRAARSKGYGFQIELCYRVWQYSDRIAQVPIAFTDRVRGHSKMSLSVGAEELGLVTWWALQDRVLKGRWRR